MALGRKPALQQFSIDDAFDDKLDDIIIISDSTTLGKTWNHRRNEDNIAESVDRNESNGSQPVLLSFTPGSATCDSASKGSDSLINESSTPAYFTTPEGPWWHHPRVRENWKVVVGSIALLVVGIGLLILGIVVFLIPSGGVQGLVFLIAGAICFIPGAYHVIYVYLAVKGIRGYDFYHLPLFN